ncbi:MAG: hypothetical protein ABII82_16445 [Verrucomicrobiota bacterium]
MKTHWHLLAALLLGLITPVVSADEGGQGDTTSVALLPLEPSQRILATKSARMGIDTLIYKRVTPPSITPSRSKTISIKAEALPSPLELDPPREYRSFLCSIVPYPMGVSEIQWSDEDRIQKRVFVHDDLTFLGFSFGVNVDDIDYNFITLNYGGYGDSRLSDFPRDIQRYIQIALGLPAGQFAAVPAATGRLQPLTASEADSIDVMLAYYQVNRALLKTTQEKAEARAKIEAEAKRIRDLTPKTVEIRLWPVTSQRYQTAK